MFKVGDKVARIPCGVRVADGGLTSEGIEREVTEISQDGTVIMVKGSPYTYVAKFFRLVEDTPTFKNMKFRVSSPEQSKEIQEALFEMGYKWEAYGTMFKFLNEVELTPWLHTDEVGVLYRSNLDPDDEFSSISPFRHQECVVETTKSYKLIPVVPKVTVEPAKETITIDGKTYDKEAVLKRLAELVSV